MHRKRMVGVAALVEAATFLVGFALYATVLADYSSSDSSPAESVATIAEHEAALYLSNVLIYIVFGIVLVVLTLALGDLLRRGAPTLAAAGVAFGQIRSGLVLAAGMVANTGIGTVLDLRDTAPDRAETVWSALDVVQNGLGGGIEVVGGVWLLLVSWAALRSDLLPAPLNYLGLVVAAAGIVTVVPSAEAGGAVFGLGLIVWFTWLGALMLRDARSRADAPHPATSLRASADGARR